MGPLSIRIQLFMTLLDVFLARCVLPAASENQTPPNENAFSQKFETWCSCFFETLSIKMQFFTNLKQQIIFS